MDNKKLQIRLYWTLVVILSALFLVNIILTLSPRTLQWATTRTHHISGAKPDSGYAYRFDLPLLAEPLTSNVQLYENGILLEKVSGDLLFTVARDGAGGFGRGVEGRQIDKVFFSASDNSDPRLNGKDYTLQYKYPPLSQKRMIFLSVINLAFLVVLAAWRKWGAECWKTYNQLKDQFQGIILWGIRLFLVANLIALLVLLARPLHSLQFMFTVNFILYAGFVLWLSYNHAGILDKFIALGLVCGLFAASLAAVWQFEGTPIEGVSFIGGLLPYSDANGYWKDMMRLIHGHPVTYSVIFKRIVPTSTGAVLYRLSGKNLQLTLLELALLWGISTWMVSVEVRKSIGRTAAAVVVLLGWGYFNTYPFAGTLLSENLAYILGAGGAAVLLFAMRKRSPWAMGLGVLLVTHAINSRTGAVFVIPAVIVWAALNLEKKYRIKFVLGVVALIVLLNLYVDFLGVIFGTAAANSASNANFYSLVSLVWGRITGSDYMELYRLYPEMKLMDYGAQTEFVVVLLKELIVDRPAILLDMIVSYPRAVLSPGSTTLSLFFHQSGLNFAAHCFLILGLLVSLLRWRKPVYGLMLSVFLGILFSSPALVLTFHRPVAPVYIFSALMVGVGLQSLMDSLKGLIGYKEEGVSESGRENWPVVFGVIILLLTLVAPLTLKLPFHPDSRVRPTLGDCSEKRSRPITAEAPRAGSYLNLVETASGDDVPIQRAPEISADRFIAQLGTINVEDIDVFDTHATSGTIVFVDQNYNFVLAPDEILELDGWVQLCGIPVESSFIVVGDAAPSGNLEK
jgi:hypothetical protein